ncbi:MAG: Dam family site-specific DNA-(adenine-N6)-methyltransferase [Myxococcota bacterium]
MTLRPFLRWVGGKRWLLPSLDNHLPEVIKGRYIAPFLGGGALFFHLQGAGRLRRKPLLGDANRALIKTYRALRDDVEMVISGLGWWARFHADDPKETFKLVRARFNQFDLDRDEPYNIAVTFIYLNQTCFNGLYRVNRKGKFNVGQDEGRKAKHILDADLLRSVSGALQGVDLVHSDFEQTIARARRGDVIYGDPPYVKTFGKYAGTGFTLTDHTRLRDGLEQASRRGARVLTSNSSEAAVKRLYRAWEWDEVYRRGTVSAGKDRRPIPELLIHSFEPSRRTEVAIPAARPGDVALFGGVA